MGSPVAGAAGTEAETGAETGAETNAGVVIAGRAVTEAYDGVGVCAGLGTTGRVRPAGVSKVRMRLSNIRR